MSNMQQTETPAGTTRGLRQGMGEIKQIFNDYAGIEGDATILEKAEFSKLLMTEFDIKQEDVQGEIEVYFHMFEKDGDESFGFQEFVRFSSSFLLVCLYFNVEATKPGLKKTLLKVKKIFDEYAGEEGDSNTLINSEVSTILHNEFPDTGTTNQDVETFFNKLDDDRDGIVDFTEFASAVSILMEYYDNQESSSETTSGTQQTATPAESSSETTSGTQQTATPAES